MSTPTVTSSKLSVAAVFTHRNAATGSPLGYAAGHITSDGNKALCGRPVAVITGGTPDTCRNVECTVCIRKARKLGMES